MFNFSLLIVTHNSASWLPALATSMSPALDRVQQLLIADAGSTDQTIDDIFHFFPSAQVLELSNIGFGTAANRGFEQISSPWILLCNADLQFAPDFFGKFLAAAESRAAEDSHIACFAPTLLNPGGSLQPSVGRFPTIRSLLRDQFRPRLERKYIFPQPMEAGPIDWATGACLLLRHDAFLRVAGFDEKYFLYHEDIDLQRRLKDAGYQTQFVPLPPNAGVIHLSPNAARPPRPAARRYAARGLLRYFAKFGTPAQRLACRGLLLFSGRLGPSEALASRSRILATPTGP